MKLALVLLALAFPCVCSAGYVQTMTFDELPPGEFPTYEENGITATGVISAWPEPGSVHIDREGTPLDQPMFFTTGSIFTPVSVMLRPAGSAYCSTCEGWPLNTQGGTDPIPYIWFSGYLDDVLVSTAGFYLPAADTFSLFSLSFLGQIDTLRIEAKNFMDFGLPGTCSIDQGCGHFNIDDLTLKAEVPEPGTMLLLGIGLLGAALVKRRLAAQPPLH